MDETKLKELGLTDEQITSVKQLAAIDETALQDRINTAVGAKETELNSAHDAALQKYKDQLNEKDMQFATHDFISKYKFTSKLAKDMALQKLREEVSELKDGKLTGADKFIEDLKSSNPEAFASEEAYVVASGGGGTAGSTAQSGVEKAFYNINPGLKPAE